MAKITALIGEGKIKAIDGIPIDMYIEVRNYDVDLLPGHALSKDEYTRACQTREWRAPQ